MRASPALSDSVAHAAVAAVTAALLAVPHQLMQAAAGPRTARRLLEARLHCQSADDEYFIDGLRGTLVAARGGAPLEPAFGKISLLRDVFQCLRQLARIDAILPVRPGTLLAASTDTDSDDAD